MDDGAAFCINHPCRPLTSLSFQMIPPSPHLSQALPASLTQGVDGGADLEGGTQLDIHGGDEMVLSQEQQSLPIDFL